MWSIKTHQFLFHQFSFPDLYMWILKYQSLNFRFLGFCQSWLLRAFGNCLTKFKLCCFSQFEVIFIFDVYSFSLHWCDWSKCWIQLGEEQSTEKASEKPVSVENFGENPSLAEQLPWFRCRVCCWCSAHLCPRIRVATSLCAFLLASTCMFSSNGPVVTLLRETTL